MEQKIGERISHRIEAGQLNTLAVTRFIDHGLILRNHNGDEEILLPKAYVTEKMRKLGRGVEVFVYTDSEDRPVATTLRPVALLGELGVVEVVDVKPYGAFVEWGLPKDLLVPLSQQKSHVRIGDRIIVRVELDEETGRMYGTQRIGRGFERPRGLVPSQKLRALVIAQTPMGYKLVVEHSHEGMVYHNEVFQPLAVGEWVTVYVRNLRPDGKLDLSLQPMGKQAKRQTAEQVILDALRTAGGQMDITSKSSPERIQSLFGISKKQFKAGLTALVGKQKVILGDYGIKLA
jgi:predicted RNA-binding protein (virulence factor B family)